VKYPSLWRGWREISATSRQSEGLTMLLTVKVVTFKVWSGCVKSLLICPFCLFLQWALSRFLWRSSNWLARTMYQGGDIVVIYLSCTCIDKMRFFLFKAGHDIRKFSPVCPSYMIIGKRECSANSSCADRSVRWMCCSMCSSSFCLPLLLPSLATCYSWTEEGVSKSPSSYVLGGITWQPSWYPS